MPVVDTTSVIYTKVVSVEHGSKQTRYKVESVSGKIFSVGEKQLHFVVPPPPNPKDAIQLLIDFDEVHRWSSYQSNSTRNFNGGTLIKFMTVE